MDVSLIECRTILNRTGGFLAGFTHTLNPYAGCTLGGSLCGMPDYAPEVLAGFGEKRPWGSWLGVKANAPGLYDADHDRIRAGADPALRIFMSSVTDPWLPQERTHRVTRRLLGKMRERPPDLLALQTHTPNPIWDIDLLAELSARFPLTVQITIETDRESLGPLFRPHAYSIASRLEALAALRARGIPTVGVVAPLWPIEDIDRFARRLEACCDFVVIDHFLLGDGSKDGARTKRRLAAPGRTFPQLLEEAGYVEWATLAPFEGVVDRFRAILGDDRLGVSREGFIRAAHRLSGVVRSGAEAVHLDDAGGARDAAGL